MKSVSVLVNTKVRDVDGEVDRRFPGRCSLSDVDNRSDNVIEYSQLSCDAGYPANGMKR
jgi:hypothetical protein